MSELHDKGEQIYKTQILPQLAIDKLKGKIIAIEIKSADYFIEDTVLKAVMLGRKRYPQQKFYCKRIGCRTVYSYPSYVPTQETQRFQLF
ncbi:MAG: hypothetical protein VSS75_033880 [Candidatus Parabeggiatoa sp.]|nr:hypothetical protein [Candidatus Parabeggiatoa sp.]HIE01324.1 hypothetical protein [Thiotrichaceae bacterium]